MAIVLAAALLVAVATAVLARRALPAPEPPPPPLPPWRGVHDRVLAQARRALADGERCLGEALLRRAVRLAARADVRTEAAAELARAGDRAPSLVALGPARIVICVELRCALMRWRHRRAAYEPFAVLPDRWFLLAPAAWADAPALPARIAALAEAMLAETNARRARTEPSDPSFLAIDSQRMRVLAPADLLAEPWSASLRHTPWAPSAAFVVDEHDAFFPCRPSEFVPLVFLSLALAGHLTAAVARARLVAAGMDPRLAAGLTDPARELRASLAFYLSPAYAYWSGQKI